MKSFLYLIYSDLGFMIGKSSDIYRRFAVIDNHSPIDLILFRVYKIAKNGYHEKRLHKKYASKQIRGGWFDLDNGDIEDIDTYITDNEGIRILDNRSKTGKRLNQKSRKPDEAPGNDLTPDLEKLEAAIAKLKDALNGRTSL